MAAAHSLTAQIGWNDGWRRQRATTRKLVVLAATVHFQGQSHVGLIRDISRDGLFLYSDFTPQIGENLRVVIQGRGETFAEGVSCAGKVVRVETKGERTAVGIAVKISAYEV